jgi:hypothetical protein
MADEKDKEPAGQDQRRQQEAVAQNRADFLGHGAAGGSGSGQFAARPPGVAPG